MKTRHTQILSGGLLSLSIVFARGAEPPVIPVGLDAYRQWERWPYQRIGARAYMRSTHDRTGGNESADASQVMLVAIEIQPPHREDRPSAVEEGLQFTKRERPRRRAPRTLQ